MDSLTELSLFSGYGGASLGLKLAGRLLGFRHRTVCYVEIEPYCQDILKARIADGWLDDAPIWDDVHTFDGQPWRGVVDIVTAGFPCQPFSHAGKRKGGLDDRNLWPQTVRIIRAVRPRFVLLENVSGLLSVRRRGRYYVQEILRHLAESGYDAVWKSVPASDAGAPHKRLRWFCLAYAQCAERGAVLQAEHSESDGHDGQGGEASGRAGACGETMAYATDDHGRTRVGGTEEGTQQDKQRWRGLDQRDTQVADASGPRLEEREGEPGDAELECPPAERDGRGLWPAPYGAEQYAWEPPRLTEPGVGVLPDGRSTRVGELRALGNGIVPQQLAVALVELLGGLA